MKTGRMAEGVDNGIDTACCWSSGFEIFLELGVLLFQVRDSFLLKFVFLLFLAQFPLQALVFSFQSVFVPLQIIDLFSLPFENCGKTGGPFPRGIEIPLRNLGMIEAFVDTHPPYIEPMDRNCPAIFSSVG